MKKNKPKIITVKDVVDQWTEQLMKVNRKIVTSTNPEEKYRYTRIKKTVSAILNISHMRMENWHKSAYYFLAKTIKEEIDSYVDELYALRAKCYHYENLLLEVEKTLQDYKKLVLDQSWSSDDLEGFAVRETIDNLEKMRDKIKGFDLYHAKLDLELYEEAISIRETLYEYLMKETGGK